MINIDILSYFLDHNSYRFRVSHYNNSVFTSTIRHFDVSEEHLTYDQVLVIVNENRIDDYNRILNSVSPSNIIVYITSDIMSPFSLKMDIETPVVIVETDAPIKLYNLLGSMNEKFSRWERNLQLFSLTSKNYQDLADYSDDILEQPFSLLDKDFVYIAYSKSKSAEMGYIDERVENGRLSIKIAAQLLSTPGYEELESHNDVFDFEDDYHFLAKNIRIDDCFLARLVLMYSKNPYENAYHSYILQRLGECITDKYSREGTFYVNQEPSQLLRLFMRNSLSGQSVTQALWQQALQEKNWAFQDTFRIMVFDATYRREKKLHSEYLCPQIENQWHYTAATEWNGKTIVLINQKFVEKQFEQALAYFVRDNLLTAGISIPFTDFSHLPQAVTQAEIAMDLGIQEHPHLWYYFFENYTISHIKKQCTSILPAEFICHPALLTLKEYDEANGSQYYESLKLFIQTQYNMSAAADCAYVHRTTFIKRMERIVQLTDIDLTDWNTRMHLMLSYQLL